MSVHKDKERGTWRVVVGTHQKRGFRTKFDAQQYEAMIRLKEKDISIGILFKEVADDYVSFKLSDTSYSAYIR
jgi:hypothetical protein